jgi:hypothetical protein
VVKNEVTVKQCYCVCCDFTQSPPVTKAKLNNRRTKFVQKLNKERQADEGFGSSLTDKIMWSNCRSILIMLLVKIAYNVQGLAFGGEIINVPPEPLPIYLLMLNYVSNLNLIQLPDQMFNYRKS